MWVEQAMKIKFSKISLIFSFDNVRFAIRYFEPFSIKLVNQMCENKFSNIYVDQPTLDVLYV